MINTTFSTVVFNVMGAELSELVRASLELAAEQHLVLAELQDISVESVGTKSNLRGAFEKFVKGRVLQDLERKFDDAYVECALEAYEARLGHLNKELFDIVMAADQDGSYSYKRSYAASIKVGLGMFLVALHSSGAITLPATFTWPRMFLGNGCGRRREVGKYVASELLSFIRTLDTQVESLPHPAFEAIGGNRKRREWFLSYATKLLLACGWHKPEDVNVADLLEIKSAERVINGKDGMPLAYRALLDVLNLAFPNRVSVTSEDWAKALKSTLPPVADRQGQKTPFVKTFHYLSGHGPRTDRDLLDELQNMTAAWGKPDQIKSLSRLPGLDVDFAAMSAQWVNLQELFVSKVAREDYRSFYHAVGWWNVYLFYYLPYWFARNPESSLVFPSSPSLLKKSVFVSRLLPIDEEAPITFVELMNAQAEKRQWGGNSYYATLRNLQTFFEFVERYSEEIPGCKGFTQPLSPYDYPRTSRPKNTIKEPVPRRFFGVLLEYYEALIAHQSMVTNRILTGEISEEGLRQLTSQGNIIDTLSTSDIVGFIPVLFTKTKALPLQFIPNVLVLRRITVRGGNRLMLPHPHALIQNLVVLHTGVRHNHVQWLDRDKFDQCVNEGDTEFSVLFVNTDKQKTAPWKPYVNFRVIELLRAQREWCELIDNPSFHSKHYYNENPNTKWPPFRPLFAYTSKGAPHHDSLYGRVWKAVLCGLQGLISDLSELGQGRRLVQLLPPGFEPGDPNLSKKLIDYGSTFTKMGESCPLQVHTASTPHSARVAVVSQYITFLPVDLIGKYITGQRPGTVTYYVHLEQEDLEAAQVHQAARMRNAILKSAFEPVLEGNKVPTAFIHADEVNSNLAKSMQVNLEETIAAYGGMSISFMKRAKDGVGLLREMGCSDIAFNKTEVCPYGNNCPPDIVKELNGLRRCSLCPYAIRFIDHLPAIMAKKRQVADAIDELESALATEERTLNAKYTPTELDRLDSDRARLCEDLTGWILNEEVLEVVRQRISAGQDTRIWTVQRPEIIERNLKRIAVPTSESEYILARLAECVAFPILESPQVRARFDLLRRELLARSGRIRDAFGLSPIDPTLECVGMLKSIFASRGLTVSQIANLIESEVYMSNLPKTDMRLLSTDDIA